MGNGKVRSRASSGGVCGDSRRNGRKIATVRLVFRADFLAAARKPAVAKLFEVSGWENLELCNNI